MTRTNACSGNTTSGNYEAAVSENSFFFLIHVNGLIVNIYIYIYIYIYIFNFLFL